MSALGSRLWAKGDLVKVGAAFGSSLSCGVCIIGPRRYTNQQIQSRAVMKRLTTSLKFEAASILIE